MSPSQVIVLATPVFFLLIALEFAWGWAKKRNTYRLNDAVNSIALGMLSQITAVFMPLLTIGIYTVIHGWVSTWHNEAFWMSWYGWLLALVFYDFCYYWEHRLSHRVGVLWASHVVHHQSQDYNLSTALRQPSTRPLLNWIFYLPMAVAGVPPLVFGVVLLVDLLYQFWVHTEHVPRLGWFDRWFCSPSNHRVHHGVNDRYLDRNYGGVLVIWDRMFGSFKEEDEKCIYGTRSPLNSWDPLWSNAEVYWALARDSWHARSWADKVRVWFKPPGWRPADVAANFPRAPFDVARVERYHPPMPRGVAWFGAVQFTLLLWGVAFFLWHADTTPWSVSAIWLGVLAAGLWAVGAVMQGRVTVLEVLLIEAAALATATSAVGLVELHRVFKPLAMIIAIVFVAARARQERAAGRFDRLLGAGLAFSLVGDVFLMFPGRFIAGLVSFLIAHLCYIALFKQGLPFLPRRGALAATLGLGVAMYGLLFASLGPVLKVAVAAYVVVIAVMAAQAIGRSLVLGDAASRAVAIGAGFFMLSDSLLALNLFWRPIPLAPLWVLSTYYVAQILIARFARPTAVAVAQAHSANSSPALLGGATPR